MSHRVQTQSEKERERESTKALQHLAIVVVVVVQILSASVAARTNIKINSLWPTHVLEWRQQRLRGTKQLPWPFAPAPAPTLNRHPQEHDKLFVWVLQVFAKMSCHLFAFSIYFFIPFGCPPESAALEFASPISGMSLLPPLHSFRQCLSLSPVPLTVPCAAILSLSCPPVCIFHFGTHILLSSKVDRGFEDSLSLLPLTIYSILLPPPPSLSSRQNTIQVELSFCKVNIGNFYWGLCLMPLLSSVPLSLSPSFFGLIPTGNFQQITDI